MNHFVQAIKSAPVWLAVLALHALVLWQLLQAAPVPPPQNSPKPLMISVITPPPVITPSLPPKSVQKPVSKKTGATKKWTKPRQVKKAKTITKVRRRLKKPEKTVSRKPFRAKTQKAKTPPPVLKEEIPLFTPPVLEEEIPIYEPPLLTEEIPIYEPPLLTEEEQPSFRKQETLSFREQRQEDISAAQTKTTSLTQSHGSTKQGGITTPPSYQAAYLHNPAPSYPRLSKRRGEEGTVLLRVKVNQNGRAALIQLKESSGFNRLDKAALKVVNQWRFIPAQKAGQAVSGWVIVPIVFQLR